MILIIYHSVDFDGICSRLITQRHYPGAETLGWTYGDPIPENLDRYEKIVMVDISFPVQNMLELKSKLEWVDHHITAIKDSESFGYSDVPGKREIGRGACELAWEYFMKTSVPKAVEFISAYDVFDKVRFGWISEVLPFQYALRTRYGLELPDEILDFEPADLVLEGKLILKYLKQDWENMVKSSSIPITVNNLYKGICLITPVKTSLQFDCVYSEYDLFVFGTFDSSGKFKFTLSSNPDRVPEFNCGQYMKDHYSGGGHKGVAGGFMSLDQFTKFIKDRNL